MKTKIMGHALLLAVTMATTAFADETCTCKCKQDQTKQAENMVLTPCYPEQPKPVRPHKIVLRKKNPEKQCEVQAAAPAPEKVQYTPEREIPSVTEERQVPKEQTDGAIYGPGHEVQVVPQAGHEVKVEKIDEAPPEVEKDKAQAN